VWVVAFGFGLAFWLWLLDWNLIWAFWIWAIGFGLSNLALNLGVGLSWTLALIPA
jgi:hypothetical protein